MRKEKEKSVKRERKAKKEITSGIFIFRAREEVKTSRQKMQSKIQINRRGALLFEMRT